MKDHPVLRAVFRPAGTPPDLEAADTPTSLAAAPTEYTAATLTWTDNSGMEDGFKIEQQADGGGWSQVATVAADVTTYGATGLTPGVSYDWRVRAYAGTDHSPYSNTASEAAGFVGTKDFQYAHQSALTF